jgi:hypothetical protein
MLKKIFCLFLLAGCAGTWWVAPDNFLYVPVNTGEYEIATWQKINNPKNSRIHIYIEGDGNAFDSYGQPTDNPTPHGTLVRDLAVSDTFDNVVYMARPCQFIMSKSCSESDWTDGRFSQKIIDSESIVLQKIATNKKITLIGYSGGAMVSGLIIKQNPKLNFEKWITVAGVLNHKKWTDYFGDEPLIKSIDMEILPDIAQKHFVGGRDNIVPPDLAKQWSKIEDIVIIDNATHDDFGKLKIFD